ncbi:hypothetical protein G6321_00002660 (plasmid) [Bradyrhizobium barranii subsp. barranii]|uniref:Uncharacterized protein n=1 Tax=Bradyrhizobium barranii subsp. barranii TaxID=2823807 RepID=A0A7Z0QNG6_9BRAD|nr:hypothetical protein [Bradyrhizobium barranii]UGX89850.1 hypothetical protein G6321_00002660 [Bradyrhizobium barranii subsp. barranii]
MSMKVVTKPIAKVIKQPRPFGAGREWKAMNFKWRDVRGNDHVVVFTTGMPAPNTPEGIGHFNAVLAEARSYAAYCTKTGDGFGEFRVSRNGEYFGRGWFPAGTTAEDVPFLLARLLKQGLRGHIVPGIKRAEDVADALGVAECFANASRPVSAAPYDFHVSFTHFDDGTREYLSIAEGDSLPPHLAGVYEAKLADYRKVLAVFQPRAFRIYNVGRGDLRPTAIMELRPDPTGDLRYHEIGSIPDGASGGGYIAEAHGRFGEPPTADEFGRISARLAATGRWMTLVKEKDDNVNPETMLLMSTLSPEEFVFESDDFG